MAAMLGSSFAGSSIVFSSGTTPSFVLGVPSPDFRPPFVTTPPSFGPVPPFSGTPIVPPFDTLAPLPSGFGPQAAPLVTPSQGRVIFGTDISETLVGSLGNDVLFGEGGADTISGGLGNDALVGGTASDVLEGGPGADVFVFRTGDGQDVITDFEAVGAARAVSVSSTLTLDSLQARIGFPSFPSEDTLLLQREAGEPPPVISTAPGETLITFTNGDAIRLLGVADGAILDGTDVIL